MKALKNHTKFTHSAQVNTMLSKQSHDCSEGEHVYEHISTLLKYLKRQLIPA